MAKILYTVCGVGLGHAMRSGPIIDSLQKSGHKLIVSSYSNAFKFLDKKFGKKDSIQMFDMLKNTSKSFWVEMYDVQVFPRDTASNLLMLLKIVEEFEPDVIVSDFDLYSSLLGLILDVPVILLSNMHISEYHPIEMSIMDRVNYFFREKVILRTYPKVDKLIMISFIKPKQLPKNYTFFYYPVRKEITFLVPRKDGFFVVYGAPKIIEKLVPVLKKFPEKNFWLFLQRKKILQKTLK